MDYSEKVIEEMNLKAKVAGKAKALRYEQADLRDMSRFSDRQFHTIVDKACLDAIYTESSAAINTDVERIVNEMCRVLEYGGRYICITLAQSHVLDFLLRRFRKGWTADVHWIATNSPLSSFLFSFTKSPKAAASSPTKWNVHFFDDTDSAGSDGDFIRSLLVAESERRGDKSVACEESVCEDVVTMQRTVYVRRSLRELRSSGGVRFETALWASSKSLSAPAAPKYEISVVDRCGGGSVSGSRCAVLLVPPERFREWIFAESEGQLKLCGDAGYARLIIARLHPAHAPLEEGSDKRAVRGAKVQEELSPLVLPFAPRCVQESNEKIPFISIGPSDDGAGSSRRRIAATNSPLSGKIVVEEVVEKQRSADEDRDGSDDIRTTTKRQMIFLNSPQHIQSEIFLVAATEETTDAKRSGKKGKGGGKRSGRRKRGGKKARGRAKALAPTFDHASLSFDFYRAMIASLAILPAKTLESSKTRVLVIGLGGGVLPMFLHRQWPRWSRVDVVEIDPAVVDVAKSHFGFVPTKKRKEPGALAVHVCDGIRYVEAVAKRAASSSSGRRGNARKRGSLEDSMLEMLTLADVDIGDGDDARYDAIFVNANTSDSSLAMAFPPPPFLTRAFLVALRKALNPGGIVITNVCSRSPRAYASCVSQYRSVFRSSSSSPSKHTKRGEEKKGHVDVTSDLVLELRLSGDSVNSLVVALRPSENDGGGGKRLFSTCSTPEGALRKLQRTSGKKEGAWGSETSGGIRECLGRFFFPSS